MAIHHHFGLGFVFWGHGFLQRPESPEPLTRIRAEVSKASGTSEHALSSARKTREFCKKKRNSNQQPMI